MKYRVVRQNNRFIPQMEVQDAWLKTSQWRPFKYKDDESAASTHSFAEEEEAIAFIRYYSKGIGDVVWEGTDDQL